jgi:SIR2-like protein
MSEENRLALLAGAGLTVDAGLPTSVQLAKGFRKKLVEMSQSSEGGSMAVEARERSAHWLSLFNFLDGGVRFQEGVLNRDPDMDVNIEQIAIAALELQARTTNPLAAYAAGWHRRIEQLEEKSPGLLGSFLDFTYSRLQEWLALADPKSATYLRGLGELCIDGDDLDIFTLNYDLCIETALTAANLKFSNGFDSSGVWSPSAFSDSEHVRLYKLHGSLDWVDDQIYGLCSLQFPRHENAETIKADDVRPQLIFGTAHKLSAREPFLTLAYHFSQRVLQTKVLAVVGYSFGDEHVNQIIEQGLKKNGRLRLVVVSPDASKLVRGKRFLDRNPRVSTIIETAKISLNERLLTDRLREVLKDVSTEAPFS